jgi:hypothetical protein
MRYMFEGASAFDEDVKGWNVCKVPGTNFNDMFLYSGQEDTTLVPPANGECIACPANSTSGSGKYVEGGNNCTPV